MVVRGAVVNLVILGISLLTSFVLALKEVLVAKLVILGISFLTSFILALRVVLVVKLVISGILSSIFLILALYTSFSTTSVFTTSLSLLKSTGTDFYLSASNSDNLSISNLSTTSFKLAKSSFLANWDVSTPVAFLNRFCQILLHN